MSHAYSTLRVASSGPHSTGGLGGISPKRKINGFSHRTYGGRIKPHKHNYLRGAVIMVCSKCGKTKPLTH